MKKILFALLFLTAAQAEAVGGWVTFVPSALYVDDQGNALVMPATPQPGTCSWWGWSFTFDTKSVSGEKMYSTALAAKLTGKQVGISYEYTTTPGKDHTNGCTLGTMAKAHATGIF